MIDLINVIIMIYNIHNISMYYNKKIPNTPYLLK